MFLGTSTKNYDNQEHEDTEQEKRREWTWKQHRCAEQRHVWDDENSRDHDWRVTNCNQQTQRQICRQQRNQSRRHQSMRRWDDRCGETDLQRNRKAKWLYSRGMAKTDNKSDKKKRSGRCWKPPPDLFFARVVQTVHDNTVQQIVSKTWSNPSGRAGGIQRLLPNNRPSCDAQNDWSEILKMWAATIDFMKAFDSITHESIWDALKSCGIEHDYINFLKKLYRDQKATVLTESDMFEIKKGTKLGAPLSSLLFNTVLQKALEENIPRWQKKRGMGICLSDNDHDCFTNMRFAADVLQFASSKEQLQKMACEFKRSTGKVGLRIHSRKTKILSNQSFEHQKRNWDRWHQSRNINKRRQYKTLGPDDNFPAAGDDRNHKSYQGCLGHVPQEYKGTDIENLHAWTSTSAFRRSGITDDELRLWNLDTHRRAWKNDSIDATQNVRLIVQTKRTYKKIGKRKDETNENDDTEDLGSTEDENEDGQSSNTHNDQDSDISFENDTDDEIDTTAIEEEEEEECIEYTERSTDEAVEKMENAKIRCWIKTHKRMKWRLALRIASPPSKRWIVKAAEWKPKLSSRYKTFCAIVRPRRRWEDDVNEFLKLEENETANCAESDTEDNKSWIKAAKDRGRWTLLENDYTMTAEERSENNARHRRNSQSRPARYVNGVRLSDDEVANIT